MNRRDRYRTLLTAIPAVTIGFFVARLALTGRLWHVPMDRFAAPNACLLVLLAWIFAYACAGICIYAAATKRLGFRYPWLLLLAVSLLPTQGTYESPTQREMRAAVTRGWPVVKALQRYREQRRTYPDTLNALAPHYLKSVPKTGLQGWRQFYILKPGVRCPRSLGLGPSKGRLLGKDPIAIIIPLRPQGTLVFRPSRDYSDLDGYGFERGWFLTGVQ